MHDITLGANSSWVSVLASVQRQPHEFAGKWGWDATRIAAAAPLEAAFVRGVIRNPTGAQVILSRDRFLTRVEGEGIRPRLEQAIWWERRDVLLGEVQQPSPRLDDGDPEGAGASEVWNDEQPGEACRYLYLAEYGGIGFRTGSGFWRQEYRNGWPLSEPLCLPVTAGTPAFVCFGVLGEQYFTGLPFEMAAAVQAIPEEAVPFTLVEWRDNSDWIPPIEGADWADGLYR